MATSRTGTTSHKQWRAAVLRRDKADGITQCPYCGTTLDYTHTRRPNSAEPDHIIPWANGGTNTLNNGRTICRKCNQKRGNTKRRRRNRNTTSANAAAMRRAQQNAASGKW